MNVSSSLREHLAAGSSQTGSEYSGVRVKALLVCVILTCVACVQSFGGELPKNADRRYKAKISITSEGDLPPEEITALLDVEINRPFAGGGLVQKKVSLDENGERLIETKKMAEPFGLTVEAKKHYSARVGLYRYVSPPGEYWNPPETKVTIKLRKIVKPRALLQTRKPIRYHSRQGEMIGYDLIVRDWVAPQGKGEVAEVMFSVSEWSYTEGDKRPSVILNFPDKRAGIIRVSDPNKGQVENECPIGRIAPDDGYQQTLSEKAIPLNHYYRIYYPDWFLSLAADTGPAEGYWFRVYRKNEGYYYGKITKPFDYLVKVGKERFLEVEMPYMMAPNPNDRNLEAAKSHLSYADYMEDRDQYRKGKTYEDFEAEEKAKMDRFRTELKAERERK